MSWMCGPTASRTAATIATERARSAADSSACAAPNGSSLRPRYPRATTPRARSAIASGSRSVVYQPLAYAGIRSRNRPPSSRHTGTPRACPIRSQQAMSNTDRADAATSPTRPYSARWTFQANRSTSNGSAPTTYRGRQLLDAGQQRAGLVDQADLADAGTPVIGVQLDEDQVPPGSADHGGPASGDPHRRSPGARSSLSRPVPPRWPGP